MINIICKKIKNEYYIVKGDDFIKKVTLRFLGAGYQNKYQVHIQIYDKSDMLVCDTITFNGRAVFMAEPYSLYKIVTFFNGLRTAQVFYVNDKQKIYNFVLLPSVQVDNESPSKKITFLLTDNNYANLPVMNGEIILWQNQ